MNGVTVSTDENGLPERIDLSSRALRLGGDQLATEILRQCHQAATISGARARQELAALGIDRRTLDAVGLPTLADIAEAEAVAGPAAMLDRPTMLDRIGIAR
ncbi:hypothetical protein HT102_08590 [Hoyosella sp. G463]|uniref:Uncharacterized protein n=1 Tax=Lolliginicoccus lacisalsi TaxID=2742202 RepID=A0A927PMM0_9ACTN|nr:hypothetical protein [Lolliginicoccus lacisalsi]MBD8506541.1 hypothetical protein [Lolliginicoccus lacisalsi]